MNILSENMKIACVFHPSNEFGVDYLTVFSKVFSEYHSEHELICFVDEKHWRMVPKGVTPIPLSSGEWSKGWFSKMELFRPDVDDDLFFTDLDNIIMSPLDEMFDSFSPDRPAMIKDLDPKQTRLQSAVMWIPRAAKSIVWDPFINGDPVKETRDAGKFGDAHIMRKLLNRGNTDIIQDTVGKDSVISFHLHWRRMDPRKRNNIHPMVMCFHGAGRKPMNYPNDGIVIQHFTKYLK